MKKKKIGKSQIVNWRKKRRNTTKFIIRSLSHMQVLKWKN